MRALFLDHSPIFPQRQPLRRELQTRFRETSIILTEDFFIYSGILDKRKVLRRARRFRYCSSSSDTDFKLVCTGLQKFAIPDPESPSCSGELCFSRERDCSVFSPNGNLVRAIKVASTFPASTGEETCDPGNKFLNIPQGAREVSLACSLSSPRTSSSFRFP